ncbi:ABC transporter ATP-binding protein [Clostridium sp. BL-8]|uniref:ABC transporter ATP-binding protein n=1 Tax=Clostridium sp. BL-8 TaxID=349938 RepID=UPI00098BDE58|nr:ABC transporter ATP-binding protein [Clostridium sp. BL-8]OOM69016.1 putative ABC transporter ATP-binding protein YbhF [Clostridium sp. BL-8]
MNTGQVAVELRDLSKIIGKKKLIDNISIKTYHGEVFGLLGLNGAGKTTIMRMITGLIKPTEGSVYIEGIHVANHYEKALAHVGAIIEEPEVYKHLSGYLNLKIMANMYPNIKKDRIIEVAEFVGLSKRLKDKVKTYSLGMRQRLGIAIALLNSPKVLILDEPFNGLDPLGIREIRDTLIDIAKKDGVCVIISSHILSEMELLCDRFAIIDKGTHVETKTIGETSQREFYKVYFEMLNVIDYVKINEILNSISVKVNKISDKVFSVTEHQQTVSKIINILTNSSLDIVSVIPQKKSLEEYFIGKTGGQNK